MRTAEIAALFDADSGRAPDIAREFEDPAGLLFPRGDLRLAELTLIDVVTPEELHLEPVTEGHRRRQTRLCGEAACDRSGDCARMIEAAEHAGRFSWSARSCVSRPSTRCCKDEVASGGWASGLDARAPQPPQGLLPRYGRTHPAIENSIHDIDLMLWYTGSPVKRVRGYGRKATNEQTPRHVLGHAGVRERRHRRGGDHLAAAQSRGHHSGRRFSTGRRPRRRPTFTWIPGASTYWRETGAETPDFSYDPRVAGAARGAFATSWRISAIAC